MTAPSATAYKMTVKEFCELPEGPPYFQLIDGDLYMSPSPRRYHQRISMHLIGVLFGFIEEHDLGELYAAPSDVTFADDVVLNPDLYFVSRERAHILTEQGATGAPDLVIEILSPSTAKLDVGRKREIYAESGVREMWIVAPETRTVEIYRFAENREHPIAVLSTGEALTSPILPGLALPIADVFKD
jgi:Uma2 family endonuclease